jgi:hypothetical protein
VDDIRVFAQQCQELLQVDAGYRGGEVYPGTLQAAVDGEAGGHICCIGADWGKRLLQIDFGDLLLSSEQKGIDCRDAG